MKSPSTPSTDRGRPETQPPRPVIRSQPGFTLVELLVAMALSVLVIGVPMTFVVLSLTQQNSASSRAVAATQEEVGIERLVRDIRSALSSPSSTFNWGSTSASVTLTVPTAGTGGTVTQVITWSCTFGAAGTCTRQVNTGTPVKELSNVEGVSFAPVDAIGNSLGGVAPSHSATNPAYVGITVMVLDVSQLDSGSSPSSPASGASNWITLQSGVNLRNNSL